MTVRRTDAWSINEHDPAIEQLGIQKHIYARDIQSIARVRFFSDECNEPFAQGFRIARLKFLYFAGTVRDANLRSSRRLAAASPSGGGFEKCRDRSDRNHADRQYSFSKQCIKHGAFAALELTKYRELKTLRNQPPTQRV